MKIHGLCLIKNEADIIIQTLKSASEWCDFIYVYDNGSTDGTWEKVIDLSRECKRIIPYKQDNGPFNNDLRGEVFNHYRKNSSEEDWWCRLDADEIYIDDPRIFLAKIPQEYSLVVSASFVYYFTDKDLSAYNENPSLYDDDVPIEKKCRYYINNWSEPRFFRYKTDLIWNKDEWNPSGVESAPSYPVRIWLKHYQYRSPQQIQKRLENRKNAIINRRGFMHESQVDWKTNVVFDPSQFVYAHNINYIANDWRDRIVEASDLNFDAHDGKYVLREDIMQKIPAPRIQKSSKIYLFHHLRKMFRLPWRLK